MREQDKITALKKRMIRVSIITAILLCSTMWTSCAIKSQSAIAEMEDTQSNSQLIREKGLAPEYRLGYGDVIEVKFFNDSQFNETVPVRPDGRISLQRVGDINVVGMTPSELDNIITEAFTKILRNPDVTVIVREFGGQQCYVMGEVEHPGAYPITRGMTLLRAVAAAGGPKTGANLKSLVFVRKNADNRMIAGRLDVSLAAIKENPRVDVAVQAYDMIYVPKTFISDVNAFVSQVYDLALPPLDVWTRYQYWYSR